MNAKAPKTVGEVRSLLGLANYCSRFIPEYATVIEPLRQLTKKGVKWTWEKCHDDALSKMKRVLCTKALSYFDPNLRTEITVDASPVGIAAVLCQYDPKTPHEKKIVMYASRSLTKVEQKYGQVEREALAVVWACEKFHLYVYAKEFDIITDNKAVELIFGNVRSKPKARIERWCLRLLPYKFVVKHKAGAFNIADYMSRNPTGPANDSCEKFTESYINMVSNLAVPSAIGRADLVQATKDDVQLVEVMKMIQGKPYKKVDSFEKLKAELSATKDGLILRGNRVVIPEVYQKRVIKIAHGGHMGIVKTKQLVRSHVWFSSIDKQIEDLVKSCHNCQINSDTTKFEPSCPTELPDGPWDLVSVDFYGPLSCGKYLLVLVCEYARYPLVKVISNTSAEVVIPVLNEIFSIFGIPNEVKSDNGPPFNSFKFKQFAIEQDFKHKKITPLWPRSNGMCERFMRNLGKVMRNSSTVQKNWETELLEFLRNYRDTPHASTGVAPNKLMFQHNAKTSKMPSTRTQSEEKSHLHLRVRQSDEKAKAKMKAFNDKHLKAKLSDFKVGDTVILKWKRARKSCSLFDPKPFKVVKIEGSMITVERDGKILVRNSSFMKLYVQERSQASTFEEFLFNKDFQENDTLELELTLTETGEADQDDKGVESEEESGTEEEGKDGFEMSEKGDLAEPGNSTVLEDKETGLIEDVVSVEGRPARIVKKPDRYGQTVEHGKRPYIKKGSNQTESQ